MAGFAHGVGFFTRFRLSSGVSCPENLLLLCIKEDRLNQWR